MLYKKLEERNEVYSELIDYLKNHLSKEAKESGKYIIDEYDGAVATAERGDKYYINNGLYHGFGGFALGSVLGGIATQNPSLFVATALSGGAAIYNYVKYKHMKLGDELATKMYYAKALQCLYEGEKGEFQLPFNPSDTEDYEDIKTFVDLLKSQNEKEQV